MVCCLAHCWCCLKKGERGWDGAAVLGKLAHSLPHRGFLFDPTPPSQPRSLFGRICS